MYVPGKLVESDKVLVDVGTGYFVEKVKLFIATINNFAHSATCNNYAGN